jgi:tetratricopeptide (TPR) repeat protein
MRQLKYKFLAVILLLSSCDLFDPTQGIENPNVLFPEIIGTAGSTAKWLTGQQREMAIVYNALVVNLEIASDNYDNTNTFFSQAFDVLNFQFQDANINTLQFTIADLRQSAIFGIEEVAPKDPSITNDQLAELYFYKGWAALLAGEIFVALPLTPKGVPATPAQNFDAAIVDFQEAESLNGASVSYKLALARAYYGKGDKANAVLKANEAIALSSNFVRTVQFDAVNAPTNTMQDALYDRGSFDDLQPLPRLDFLDPKFYARSGTVDSQIQFQKMEEAHMIIAEADLSNNQLATAQTRMKALRALVGTRASEPFSDLVEGRTQGSPGSRPNVNTVTVQASATDPFRSGLVLTRSATVTVPVISGTSVTDAMIDAAATTDEALELLYLMRQEVFMSEGRRFADLGLRFPISETEKQTNINVTDAQIVGFIPSFVPTNMDAFTYNAGAGTATITHNMNRVLVQNKADASVLPFH